MASVSISGDVSGAISIAAPSAAGSGVLTLPTGTDTLVGKATTDTLTNKTLTAVALGTPASGVLTNCTGVPAAALPAGTVLQVVQGTYSTQATNATSTYADTGLTASITPRSASSKILVIANNAVAKSAANTQSGVGLNIVRDATQIIQFSVITMYTNSSLANTGAAGVCYLDSPATTSATTYKMQFKNSGANAASVFAQESNSTASIVLMEIQG